MNLRVHIVPPSFIVLRGEMAALEQKGSSWARRFIHGTGNYILSTMCCASHLAFLVSLIVIDVPFISSHFFLRCDGKQFFSFVSCGRRLFGKTAWHAHFLCKPCVYLGASGVTFSCVYSPPECFIYPVFLHTSVNIGEHDEEAERLR